MVKGPPISVSCECGETAALAYGERWSCPSCGRSYDTTRIPREQYEEIRRLSLRYRALPVGFALGVALLAIFFTLTGNVPGVFFLLPTALIVWFVFLRPVHRKRYRQASERPAEVAAAGGLSPPSGNPPDRSGAPGARDADRTTPGRPRRPRAERVP